MPLAPLGFNLLEAPPRVSPYSFRSCVPPAVGWVLAPRPSPRPKPSNQLLPLGFSASLPQRHTPDFRDFPSRESVLLLVVLPTVQGRSSSRFSCPRTSLRKLPMAGSPLGPIRDQTAAAEAVAVCSPPDRKALWSAARTPCEVCAGIPQQDHRQCLPRVTNLERAKAGRTAFERWKRGLLYAL
jgi:hypothetical protein